MFHKLPRICCFCFSFFFGFCFHSCLSQPLLFALSAPSILFYFVFAIRLLSLWNRLYTLRGFTFLVCRSQCIHLAPNVLFCLPYLFSRWAENKLHCRKCSVNNVHPTQFNVFFSSKFLFFPILFCMLCERNEEKLNKNNFLFSICQTFSFQNYPNTLNADEGK